MQIIAGKLKGQKIIQPPSSVTRPVSEKVRGAIFNALADRIEGAVVLDLFAGSGALGLEAFSRGCDYVEFVDSNQNVIKIVAKNIDNLEMGINSTVTKLSAEEFVAKADKKYDLIFMDPPYAKLNLDLVKTALNLLKLDGVLVLSCSSKVDIALIEQNIVQQKIYGDTKVAYLKAA